MKLEKLPFKGWGVTGEIPWEIFYELMAINELNPFHQSGKPGTDWCFVEFWCRNEELILDRVLEVVPDIEI